MKPVDFESRFAQYARDWGQEHAQDIERMDETQLAEALERLYEDWERSPQDFLDGATPLDFFLPIESGEEAAALLRAYYDAGLAPPEGLLERLHALEEGAVPALYEALIDEEAPIGLRAYAVDMLAHVNYAPAAEYYRHMVVKQPSHPLGNLWHHALRAHQDAQTLGQWALEVYEQDDISEMAKRRLMDFFAEMPCEKPYSHIALFFLKVASDDELPYATELLLRCARAGGDPEQALNLMKARLEEDIGYLAYHEICHAIEALGGEAPDIHHDFSEDPDYLAILQQSEDE